MTEDLFADFDSAAQILAFVNHQGGEDELRQLLAMVVDECTMSKKDLEAAAEELETVGLPAAPAAKALTEQQMLDSGRCYHYPWVVNVWGCKGCRAKFEDQQSKGGTTA